MRWQFAIVSYHFMLNPYAKWMIDWETRLTMRDTNRIVRPFEWGLDWIKDFPHVKRQLRRCP